MRDVLRVVFWISVGFVGWMAFYWWFFHLSTAWQVLVLLTMVLRDLIRITGDRKFKDHHTRMVYGPLTLAGPIHPWQGGI